MNTYTIKEVDNQGESLAEQEVVANEYVAALRQVREVSPGTERIDVLDAHGQRVGSTLVSFWKKNYRRR